MDFPKGRSSFFNGRVIFLVTVLGRDYIILSLMKLLTKCCVLEERNGDFQRKDRDLKLKLRWSSFSNEIQTFSQRFINTVIWVL